MDLAEVFAQTLCEVPAADRRPLFAGFVSSSQYASSRELPDRTDGHPIEHTFATFVGDRRAGDAGRLIRGESTPAIARALRRPGEPASPPSDRGVAGDDGPARCSDRCSTARPILDRRHERLHNFGGQDLAALPSAAELGVHHVPLIEATAESLRGLGRLVPAFGPEPVDLVPWPISGWRPLVPGTGVEGGVVQDSFVYERRGQLRYAHNHAVGRLYLIGWYGDPATATEDAIPAFTDRVLTHEANYHPDGGQVFFPRDGAPFVALLAPPGDDVRPEHFRALRFDGRCGIHIDPGVWHQPVFPIDDDAVFDDKQGRVHACVSVDFVGELGCYLSVPLA